ncbi:hypothetical protein KI387_002946, partial [Taxus chinensis]
TLTQMRHFCTAFPTEICHKLKWKYPTKQKAGHRSVMLMLISASCMFSRWPSSIQAVSFGGCSPHWVNHVS